MYSLVMSIKKIKFVTRTPLHQLLKKRKDEKGEVLHIAVQVSVSLALLLVITRKPRKRTNKGPRSLSLDLRVLFDMNVWARFESIDEVVGVFNAMYC